jgi:hypothetical protein
MPLLALWHKLQQLLGCDAPATCNAHAWPANNKFPHVMQVSSGIN